MIMKKKMGVPQNVQVPAKVLRVKVVGKCWCRRPLEYNIVLCFPVSIYKTLKLDWLYFITF